MTSATVADPVIEQPSAGSSETQGVEFQVQMDPSSSDAVNRSLGTKKKKKKKKKKVENPVHTA